LTRPQRAGGSVCLHSTYVVFAMPLGLIGALSFRPLTSAEGTCKFVCALSAQHGRGHTTPTACSICLLCAATEDADLSVSVMQCVDVRHGARGEHTGLPADAPQTGDGASNHLREGGGSAPQHPAISTPGLDRALDPGAARVALLHLVAPRELGGATLAAARALANAAT
jgi:hypothetical protein